jgi:hypothetical protein
MGGPVKKEYVRCRKSKSYQSEPPGCPVYKTFKIEDQRELVEYLRFKIEQKPDGTLEQTQPTTSQPTLKDLK